MRSLQARLFLAIVLVAAAALIAVGAFSTRTTALQFELLQRSRPPVDGVSGSVLKRVQAWYAAHRSWNGVGAILRGGSADVLLFAPDGRFIAASFPGLERAALTPGDGPTIRLSRTGRQELIVRSPPSRPVADGHGRTVAELYAIRLPPPARADPARILGRQLWLAILCALVAAFAAAAILARNILAPVRGLSEAAAAMHAGNLSGRVSASGPAEIVRLAHRFNALAAHLERSEALRQRMIADIAHELRTPLTNIRGMIEAVEDGHMPANERTMSSLAEEALSLERLVDDLQDLSLADAGQIKLHISEVSAGESVRAVVAALEPAARTKKIDVRVDTRTNRDGVRADEARLRQIIANLLSNAIRLAPERSEIRVVIEAGPGSVQVSVCDQGPGLSAEALESAFERFYRADDSRSRRSGGAGLGLAIAKQLVEAQGGSIGATNNHGSGATFSFALPKS